MYMYIYNYIYIYVYIYIYIYVYIYTYIMYIPYARHMESQRSQENVWIEQIIQATPPNPSSNPLTTAAHLAKSTITSVRPNWLSKALWSWWLGFSSTAGMMWDGEPPYTTMVKAEQFRENPIISISGSAPPMSYATTSWDPKCWPRWAMARAQASTAQ